jgi:putative ABC transport system ATP-binding protein
VLLELRGVVKRFHRGAEAIAALDGVDLDVAAGELVALLGPSGSGKSTLIHLGAGLDDPDEGTISLDGRDFGACTKRERARLRRQRIGLVFQFFHLLPALTVAENVELPLTLDGRTANDATAALLDKVGLSDRAAHLPGELSGGQLQRAAIARALITEPALILADEPTGNLDSATGKAVLDVLEAAVRDAGAGMLLVTHDESVAARADRVVHLRDGKFE